LRRHGAEAVVMRSGLVDEIWRLARFSAVGALATVVHIGVAMVAVAAAGANPTVGAMIGFVAAFLVSYFGHFRFTFAVSGRYRDYLLKFAVSSLASFFLSTGAVWVATAILGIDYKPALIALALIVPVCNYLVNRFWVFLQPVNGSGHPLEIVTPE
jgi:putative flippase GtrA